MANKKISELTAYTTPVSGDVLPINDTANSTTKKITVDNLFKMLSSLFRIKDSSDTTKQLAFDISGFTAATTRTITIPDVTDTMVNLTSSQTMANKTLNAPVITSPTINLTSDAEGDTYYRNAAGAFVRLPRGTDNYIYKMNGNVPNWEPEAVIANASTTLAGIVEEATTAQIDSETQTGETGADLFMNPSQFASSTYGIMAGFFGNGADGNVTISSNTTLTRDMNYNNLTIDSTFSLTTAGYRVYVKGILTNNGTIRNNGSNASAGTGGAGGLAGTLLGGGAGGNAGGAASGGGGGGGGTCFVFARTVAVQGTIQAIGGNGAAATGASVGSNGAAGTGITRTLIQSGSGGAGGGAGGGFTGGAGGTITTNSKASPGSVTILQMMIDGVTQLAAAPGGGGGAENGAGSSSGGGGGGQGGIIVFVYHKLTTSGTLSVAGGSGGAAFGGSGVAGSSGSSGLSISIQI